MPEKKKASAGIDRVANPTARSLSQCGSVEFAAEPVAVQVQQVAQLVLRPIEIVEYQRQSCQCSHCL